MNYKKAVDLIYETLQPRIGKGEGRVADYIPALKKIPANKFGMVVQMIDGRSYGVGDATEAFSIQSISKVFTLSILVNIMGDTLWKSVGREPSGTPFNSLLQLERENGIPRNPLINAGALVVTDRLLQYFPNPKETILTYVRKLCDNPQINYNEEVATSEFENAARNKALAWFMKSFGNIYSDVDTLLDVYCHQCSLEMSATDLARAWLFLASHGVNPFNGERLLSLSMSRRLGALMLTCGLYNEAGDYAFRVGMPGKSGVGGGIAAYIPGEMAVAVWSPELDSNGNSLLGIEALERFTTLLGHSIF